MSAESSERPSGAAAGVGPSVPNEAPVRVATAGEALMDLIGQPDGRLQPCAGGSVYNLSRALALQGVSTAYLNPLSSDAWGRQLAHNLVKAGTKVACQEPVVEPTSMAVVALDAQGKAQYSFYREGVADRKTTADQLNAACHAMPELQVVATGCLALVPQDHSVYLPWLQQQRQVGRWVVVDANLRPALCPDLKEYRRHVLLALAHAHLIKASDDDLRLLGWADDDPIVAARRLFDHTPAEAVALTMGAKGAVLLQRAGPCAHAVETRQISVADTVGAGDTFLAGLLAAWLQTAASGMQSLPHGHGLKILSVAGVGQVLRHAVVSAGLCVERTGCMPPSFTEVKMQLLNSPPTCRFFA